MSQFSEALQQALADIDRTQVDFADFCEIPRPQMNKYVTGAITAGAQTLETIATALPEKQRAAVVVAYLRDRIPSSAEDIVKVSAVLGKPGRVGLPDELTGVARYAITSIAKKAVKDPELRSVLIWLDKQIA